MQAEYIEAEKLWFAPAFEESISCLGEAILTKLKFYDQERAFEINHDNGIQLTFQDVRNLTITVAHNLLQIGIEKGDIVILYTKFNNRITPITFACYAIGAPVSFFETDLDQDAISFNIGLLDPTVIIYEEEFFIQLFNALKHLKLASLKKILSLDSIRNESVEEVLFQPANVRNFKLPDLGDPATLPAALMFTSVSTGMPRIIQISHALMTQGVHNFWQLDSDSRICCVSGCGWICQVLLMLQPAFFGATRIYSSKAEYPHQRNDWRSIIDSNNITHFVDVPNGILSVLKAADFKKDPASLSSLKIALIDGENVLEPLVTNSSRVSPKCAVINGCRITEMAGIVASEDQKPIVKGGILKKGFIAKIIDDDGNSLGPNKMGRLCLKSSFPFLGYFKNEKANEETFLEDGWFDTGDYSYMDSQNGLHIVTRYEYLVRSSDVIVIPNEVEDVVNSHPNVLASALVGHPNLKNSNEELGTLFLVLRQHCFRDQIVNQLQDLIRDKLTKEQLGIIKYFKVIPEMPLTSCGKTDRWALKVLANEESRMSW